MNCTRKQKCIAGQITEETRRHVCTHTSFRNLKLEDSRKWRRTWTEACGLRSEKMKESSPGHVECRRNSASDSRRKPQYFCCKGFSYEMFSSSGGGLIMEFVQWYGLGSNSRTSPYTLSKYYFLPRYMYIYIFFVSFPSLSQSFFFF